MKDNKSKTGSVLITGASAGIGESAARLFARSGFDLILLARRGDRLDKLAAELESTDGVSVTKMCCDVTNPQSIADIFASEKETLAGVTVLINNAGLARSWGPFYNGKPEDWEKVIATNLNGSMDIARRIITRMMEKGGGHVINLGSIAGRYAHPGDALYIATKFAMTAMTKALRAETVGRGIKVTLLSPGQTKTEIAVARFGSGPVADRAWEGFDPLLPSDVAEAALWAVMQPAHVQIEEIVMMPLDHNSMFQLNRHSNPK